MHDLKLAFRQLAKAPGFTGVAVLTLALGIGANTALFSLFKAQVLAPFPYPDAGRVVQLWRTNSNELASNPWSVPDYFDVHDQCTSLAESGAYRPERFTLGGADSQPLQGVACTPGVLRALGMQPVLGRWLSDDDEKPDAPLVTLLSHACWTQHFGADPTLVGRTVRLSGLTYTVVGVMPANFEFYNPWTGVRPIDLWTPMHLSREGQYRGSHGLLVMGRLKPEATLGAAKAELKVISDRLAINYPETNHGKWFFPRPLPAEIAVKSMLRYGLVAVAAWLVLAVACANLAVMFLARGAVRQSEYAMRLALGAGRWSLIRLALTESLLVALLGGVAGTLLAANSTSVLSRLFTAFTTHGSAVQVDRGVLGFSLLLSLGAALAAGLPPALIAARTQVLGAIKEGSAAQAGSRSRHRFLRHLVSSQIAIVLILANTALLLLVSYRAALGISKSLSSEFVLSAQLTVKGARYETGEARAAVWSQLLERVKAAPGIATASVTTKLPLRGGNNRSVLVDGDVYDPTIARGNVEQSWITPEYFAAMGIPLLQGRTLELNDAQGEAPGVVVNRALVDRYWPGQDPIGKRIFSNERQPRVLAQVVGVVANVRQWDIGYPALPEMYTPFERNPRAEAFLIVRSAFDAHGIVPTLRRELAALDSDLALADPTTMAEIVNAEAQGRRTLLVLTSGFMAVTLFMSAIGIYGTLSFQMRQRTREIGVRVALGATARNIVRLVFRQTVPWLLRGVIVGILLSIGIAIVLRTLLTDINVLNPIFPLTGLSVLFITVALACWLPARRATRVNPIEALRAE